MYCFKFQDTIMYTPHIILRHVHPILGNDSVNTSRDNAYAGNNQIISVAMQRVVNKIEEEVFSMWFAYTHCWATDVFY
jgi:hypothetical protein